MKRKGKKRPPRDYIIAGILILLIVWLLFLIAGIGEKAHRAYKAAKEAEAGLASLEKREEGLRVSLEELETPRGQDASLRETYGVARPGEEVIIVIDPGEGEKLEELSWWRKFLGFFGL